MKQLRILIHGKVQGVFFRAETQKKAIFLGLTGFVQNLADGSVLTVFCGAENAVEAMLSWCYQGPPLAKVQEIEITTETPCPKAYPTFAIR
ncbi:MAG: acylphosphatase [Deltaproteobacteria bacterium]|nr:acylphosphatase [Deltaproteobacteria bacterium]